MKIFLLFFVIVFSVVNSAEVEFNQCPGISSDQCEIHSFRINPCTSTPCRLKKGKSATVEFDYTTKFTSPTMKNEVIWARSEGDIEWADAESNACLFTSCPATPNERQTFSYPFEVKRSYPAQLYQIKWKISGEQEGQTCCMLVTFRIK